MSDDEPDAAGAQRLEFTSDEMRTFSAGGGVAVHRHLSRVSSISEHDSYTFRLATNSVDRRNILGTA